jgi:hypothetical protein
MRFSTASLRLFAGPIVWALHFTVIYGLTGVACARGLPAAVPWGIGVATLAAGMACILILVRELRRKQEFLSWVAVGLAGFALLAIVWESLPVLVVTPCV